MITVCFSEIFGHKNVNSVKSTLYYVAKKNVNMMLFFSDFLQKNQCSHAHIFLKSFLSLKTRCLYAHILSKKRTLSQKHFDFMSFFQIFYEKPPVAMPMCSKKT